MGRRYWFDPPSNVFMHLKSTESPFGAKIDALEMSLKELKDRERRWADHKRALCAYAHLVRHKIVADKFSLDEDYMAALHRDTAQLSETDKAQVREAVELSLKELRP